MQKAANKAYVSGRKLEKYQQEREKALNKKQELAVISEMPGEAGTFYGARSSDLLIGGGAEEMKMPADKKGKAKAVAMNSDDDDDSAEDLDSDDLEDEIQDNVGELLQQQAQFLAPVQ